MRAWAGWRLGLPGGFSLGVVKWVRNLAGCDMSPWKLFLGFVKILVVGLFRWSVKDALTQSLLHYYTGFFLLAPFSYNHYCLFLLCVVFITVTIYTIHISVFYSSRGSCPESNWKFTPCVAVFTVVNFQFDSGHDPRLE